MSFNLTSEMYVDYIEAAAKKIHENGDYISALDAATGDGDHWANINLGFENLVAAGADMRKMPICDVFKKIGMLMMSKIGGSSGILYGGAYMAAAKKCAGRETRAAVKQASLDGAEATRGMEAVKGRASYQTNKGVGHLDPGAVTMSYQIECLCDTISAGLA